MRNIIIDLIICLVVSMCLFLYDSFKDEKKRFRFYFRYFVIQSIIFLIMNFMFNKIYGQEFIFSFISPEQSISDEQINALQKKLDYENAQYLKHYKRASELASWYLPTLTEEENAAYCWKAAGMTIGGYASSGNPMFTMIAVIIETSVLYAIDCSNQWREMQHHLEESKHHNELAWFYAGLICDEVNKRRRGY